jgi:hypothetical protein
MMDNNVYITVGTESGSADSQCAMQIQVEKPLSHQLGFAVVCANASTSVIPKARHIVSEFQRVASAKLAGPRLSQWVVPSSRHSHL